jgi:predicted nucleic acid-binding protein
LRFLEVDLEAAITLATEHGLYACDAYVLTCALQQRCALVALDATLLRVARALEIPVVEVER